MDVVSYLSPENGLSRNSITERVNANALQAYSYLNFTGVPQGGRLDIQSPNGLPKKWFLYVQIYYPPGQGNKVDEKIVEIEWPDMTPTDISFSNDRPAGGDEITITAKVKNTGSLRTFCSVDKCKADFIGFYWALYYPPGPQGDGGGTTINKFVQPPDPLASIKMGETKFSDIHSGATSDVSLTWSVPENLEGWYSVCVNLSTSLFNLTGNEDYSPMAETSTSNNLGPIGAFGEPSPLYPGVNINLDHPVFLNNPVYCKFIYVSPNRPDLTMKDDAKGKNLEVFFSTDEFVENHPVNIKTLIYNIGFKDAECVPESYALGAIRTCKDTDGGENILGNNVDMSWLLPGMVETVGVGGDAERYTDFCHDGNGEEGRNNSSSDLREFYCENNEVIAKDVSCGGFFGGQCVDGACEDVQGLEPMPPEKDPARRGPANYAPGENSPGKICQVDVETIGPAVSALDKGPVTLIGQPGWTPEVIKENDVAYTNEVTWFPPTKGNYTMRFYVDSNYTIAELRDEITEWQIPFYAPLFNNNNESLGEKIIVLPNIPDLVVSDIIISDNESFIGQYVNINPVILNKGYTSAVCSMPKELVNLNIQENSRENYARLVQIVDGLYKSADFNAVPLSTIFEVISQREFIARDEAELKTMVDYLTEVKLLSWSGDKVVLHHYPLTYVDRCQALIKDVTTGEIIDNQTIGGRIQAGSARTISIPVPGWRFNGKGVHEIKVEFDTTGKITELNETNNDYSVKVTVGDYTSDIAYKNVDDLYLKDPAAVAPQTTQINSKVHNFGTQPIICTYLNKISTNTSFKISDISAPDEREKTVAYLLLIGIHEAGGNLTYAETYDVFKNNGLFETYYDDLDAILDDSIVETWKENIFKTLLDDLDKAGIITTVKNQTVLDTEAYELKDGCSISVTVKAKNIFIPSDKPRAEILPDKVISECGIELEENAKLAGNLVCDFGGKPGIGITIADDDVVLDCNGFSITGPESGIGIYSTGKRDFTLRNCEISGFDYGAVLEKNTYFTVKNNNVHNNLIGVFLNASNNGKVSGNKVTGNALGVALLSGTTNVDVLNNFIDSNNIVPSPEIVERVYLQFENTIRSGLLERVDEDGAVKIIGEEGLNWTGTITSEDVSKKEKRDIVITDEAENNWTGMLTRAEIWKVTNFGGILIEGAGSSSNSLYNNSISKNTVGIQLRSSGNDIFNNRIEGNTANANDTASNSWYKSKICDVSQNIIGFNCTGGNAWSDYEGIDNNGDGVGDTAYKKNGVVDTYPLVVPYVGAELKEIQLPDVIVEAKKAPFPPIQLPEEEEEEEEKVLVNFTKSVAFGGVISFNKTLIASAEWKILYNGTYDLSSGITGSGIVQDSDNGNNDVSKTVSIGTVAIIIERMDKSIAPGETLLARGKVMYRNNPLSTTLDAVIKDSTGVVIVESIKHESTEEGVFSLKIPINLDMPLDDYALEIKAVVDDVVGVTSTSFRVQEPEKPVMITRTLGIKETQSLAGGALTGHTFRLDKVNTTSALGALMSEETHIALNVGASVDNDVDSDGDNDVNIRLDSVNPAGGFATYTFTTLAGAATPAMIVKEQKTNYTTFMQDVPLALSVDGPDSVTIAPGGSKTILLVISNVGKESISGMTITKASAVSGWVELEKLKLGKLESGDSESIEATITVPELANKGEYIVMFAANYGGTRGTLATTISVKEYVPEEPAVEGVIPEVFSTKLAVAEIGIIEPRTIEAGKQEHMFIPIENKGDLPLSLTVILEGAPETWKVSQGQVNVEVGKAGKAYIDIETSVDDLKKAYPVSVKVYDVNAGLIAQKNFNLALTVAQPLQVSTTQAYYDAGERATTTAKITNTEAKPMSGVVHMDIVSEDQSIKMRKSFDIGTVQPGETVVRTLDVQLPDIELGKVDANVVLETQTKKLTAKTSFQLGSRATGAVLEWVLLIGIIVALLGLGVVTLMKTGALKGVLGQE